MKESLSAAREWTVSNYGLDCDVVSRRNADGSVDAMLRIHRFPRVFPKRKAFMLGIKDVLIANRIPWTRIRGIWYFSETESTDAKAYDWRRKGQVAASTYGFDFGKAEGRGGIEYWQVTMQDILLNLRRKRNPQALTIALYYHPSLSRPNKARPPKGEIK